MLKGQNGITLVALVITIIVLLILAGVTISLTLGENGLITRAQQGQNAYDAGYHNDINAMDDATNYLNQFFTND